MIERVLVYGTAGLIFLAAAWLHGYSKGEQKLYEYQAKDATSKVIIVTRIQKAEREIDNEKLHDLQNDYDALYIDYLWMHDDAKGSNTLSSAASVIRACPEIGQQGIKDAAGILADVETGILGILEKGDFEIAKYRRLYERDVKLSETK